MSEQYDDEEEIEEAEFCDLPLEDGDCVPVLATHYPILMEWTWRRDTTTDEIVRVRDGRRLFDEQIAWAATGNREEDFRPIVNRTTLRYLCAGHPSYAAFLKLAQRQRESLLWEEQVHTPFALLFLAEVLSETLMLYHTWLKQEKRWAFLPDDEGLIPGMYADGGKPRPHETLGHWMQEYTGAWKKDRDTPTGITAQTWGHALDRKYRKVWRALCDESNFGTDFRPRAAEQALAEMDRPVWLLARLAKEIVADYKL